MVVNFTSRLPEPVEMNLVYDDFRSMGVGRSCFSREHKTVVCLAFVF